MIDFVHSPCDIIYFLGLKRKGAYIRWTTYIGGKMVCRNMKQHTFEYHMHTLVYLSYSKIGLTAETVLRMYS